MTARRLGTSGMLAPPIALGTMTFGNPLGQDQCDRLVAAALDRGIFFFDTSNVYEGYGRTWGSAGGVSELALGKALAGRRNRAIICTKFGNPTGTGPGDAGLSRRHLEQQLDASLRRLGTSHVDLFLAHRWDPAVAMDEFLGTCQRWIDAGKVLAIGASNWPVWRIAQASEMARSSGAPKLQVVSPKYNLLRRGVELEQTPCALHYGFSIAGYQSLEAGILTGKYNGGKAPEGSRGSEMPSWVANPSAADIERIGALARMANDSGSTAAEYAMAWVLSRRAVASVIVGCRNEEQLDSAVRAASMAIPQAHLDELDRLFPAPGPSGDERVLAWRGGNWVLDAREGS